ncbi:MAG TPA: hypothetical protein VG708_04495 [Mycobacteriales bacterium]|nr:hypothetical protein [Mycobacteriales bacterium]
MTDQPAEQPAPQPVIESTGVAEVDDVLSSLQAVDAAPAAEQVAIYESVHHRLHAVLTEFDDDPPASP